MSEKYLANRLKYHAASRVAIQEGESLAQALNIDGHTVNYSKVWAAPKTAFIYKTGGTNGEDENVNLVAKFKEAGTLSSVVLPNGGTMYTNSLYPAIRLFEDAVMTAVTGSNGSGTNYEAYEVIDNNGVRYQDWISPMAVLDDSGKPVPGYTAKIEFSTNGTNGWTYLKENPNWALATGNWEFLYLAGIVTFNKAYTPVGQGKSHIRITGFQYVGQYLDSTIKQIQDTLGINPNPGEDVDESVTQQVNRIDEQYLSGVQGDALSKVGKDVVLTTDNITIGQDSNGLKSLLKIVKLDTATEGYAASYVLSGASGEKIGDTIDIVKDQFLKAVAPIVADGTEKVSDATDAADANLTADHHYLKFEFWVNEDGTSSNDTKLSYTYIDIEDYFNVYTGSNGINVTGYAISGVVDESGEFLSVGPNGFKVSGVTDAITGSVEALENKLWDAANTSGLIYDAVKANSDALSTLTADASTNGSIAKAIADNNNTYGLSGSLNVSDSISEINDTLTTLMADADTEGSISSMITGAIAENNEALGLDGLEDISDKLDALSGFDTENTLKDTIDGINDKLSGDATVEGSVSALIDANNTAKFGTLTENNIVLATDSNGVKTTGKTVGGATMAEDEDGKFAGSADVVVTEAAIKAITDGDEMGALYTALYGSDNNGLLSDI